MSEQSKPPKMPGALSDEQVQMIETLIAATLAGKLKWQKMAGTYVVEENGLTFTVRRHSDENIAIKFEDEEESFAISLSDDGTEMFHLHTASKRQTLRKNLIEALESQAIDPKEVLAAKVQKTLDDLMK